ncbi:hypothetical protein PMG11_04851 [Penicillium brasilianum]|uniref:Uncharacterized protein n=1 Tax=Penicillium brasilianum TaxID=104259 RepID=A0A0F7VDT4_PENBI|nr:hypothetical protein PMG11_04851 [Penicillium brasilianum]
MAPVLERLVSVQRNSVASELEKVRFYFHSSSFFLQPISCLAWNVLAQDDCRWLCLTRTGIRLFHCLFELTALHPQPENFWTNLRKSSQFSYLFDPQLIRCHCLHLGLQMVSRGSSYPAPSLPVTKMKWHWAPTVV